MIIRKPAMASFIALLFVLGSCPLPDSGPAGTAPEPEPIFTVETVRHASDGQAFDHFSENAVSVSGDYAFVGAPDEDGGSGDPIDGAGAAYVFERGADGVWTERAILRASDRQAQDYFGAAVAVDGTSAVVGADYENGGPGDPATNAGAAYVFERDASGVWIERAVLHASDMAGGDNFGCAVAMSGDYVIVGAWCENGNAGTAYVFERDASGAWSERAVLHASDRQANDYFGCRVGVSGGTVIVGAYCEDGGSGDPQSNCGAAYIFERDASGVWTERAILRAAERQAGDSFGYAVGVSGGRAIVGAQGEDGGPGNPAANAGAAYVFERDELGVWAERAVLHASNQEWLDAFGGAVAISGNVAIVGAAYEDGADGNIVLAAGAAYVFTRAADGSWTEREILRASDREEDDNFGKSVSISGSRAVVGAPGENGGSPAVGEYTGAAYIFE